MKNGFYPINSELVFEPPKFDKNLLHHIYNNNNAILNKLQKGETLNNGERQDLNNLASTYLICYLNGFDDAIEQLETARPFLKAYGGNIYDSYKDNLRILRKGKIQLNGKKTRHRRCTRWPLRVQTCYGARRSFRK